MATSDNRWNEVEAGRVRPRTLLTKRFRSEEERIDALRIDVIKAWRLARHKKGLPSGLNDYFIVRDICPTCNGTGISHRGRYRETCFRCAGIGRFFAPAVENPKLTDVNNVAYNAGYSYASGYHD